MPALQRMTTDYIVQEDRIRVTGECAGGGVLVLWLTQRLLVRLVPPLCRWLEGNKKDTHFNCLNKQHSLNSCPWPAPVAPPSRWPTHLSETYADNFESGWISVLFL